MTAFEGISHQKGENNIHVSETQLTQKEVANLQERYVQEKNIIKEESIADRWKLRSVSLETNNDNGLSLKKGKDDGLTFGIHTNIELEKNQDKKFTISAGMDSYTENPEYRMQDGRGSWMRDFDGKTQRVDKGYIEGIYTEQKNIGDKTNITYGGGVGLGYTGDLGGQDIQNAWHKSLPGKQTMSKGNEYTVHAEYEDFKNPHLYAKGVVEGTYNINDTFYLKSEAQAQLSLYNQAANVMSAKAGAGFDTKYIRVEGGLEGYYHINDQSSIIQDFYDKGKNTGLYGEVGLGSKNGFQVIGKVSDRHGGQGSIGVKLDF